MELTWEIVERFLEFKATYKASQKTIIAYKQCVCAFFTHINLPLLEITENTIGDYLLYKLQTVSPVTANNMRRILSCFFAWCFDFKYIPYNPCTKNLVPSIRQPITVRHDITPKDMIDIKDMERNIENTLQRHRAIALIDFLESTGCRVNECIELKITDINLGEGSAVIHGKGNKERVVYINPTACKHIQDYLKYKKDINKDSIYVFSNLKNTILDKPMNPYMIENITKDLGKQCGIDNLTIHIFRRYFATSCNRRGMKSDTIRILMGHTNFSTTLRYISEEVDTTLLKYRSVC